MGPTKSVVGYHGTTKAASEQILRTEFRESTRPTLWLGFGRYFFQDAPIHALRWGRQLAYRQTGNAENAAVIAAEVDLSECIDLLDRKYWPAIGAIWENEVKHSGLTQLGIHALLDRFDLMPAERSLLTDEDKNRLGANYVDCQIMNIFIQRMKEKLRAIGHDYTTVRAAFIEGDPVYRESWLWKRSCVMISVLEPRAMSNLSELHEQQLKELLLTQADI